MYIDEVRYAMKRVTAQYENDTAEVSVTLDDGDDVGEAIALAKATCERALRTRKVCRYEAETPGDGLAF